MRRAQVGGRRAAGGAARAAAAVRAPARMVYQGKVAILGASGGIGQPLSMLVSMNPDVASLRLYDIANTPGVAADLSHINTDAELAAFTGPDELAGALEGAELVIIPAGVPRKPGMTRDDLFNINAGIVRDLVAACAEHCPGAVLNVISNPVNSTVPIAAETLKMKGVYDPRKLFGVSTLDVVRANTFLAREVGFEMEGVDVPVVGGHSGSTIVPLFSKAVPKYDLPEERIEALSTRVQNAGTEVVEAKAGTGSATLSMAYAAARFSESCLKGLKGDTVYECSYVETDIVPGCEFFASTVELGPEGVVAVQPLSGLSMYEQDLLDVAIPDIQANITKGKEFARGAPQAV